MGVLATNTREIRFYYHSGNSIGRQVLGYIHSSDKKVLEIDVAATKVTGTQWLELAHGLGVGVQELIDVSHPDFVKTYGKDVTPDDERDWLMILEKSPSLLKYPIIVSGDTYRQIKTPADVKIYLDAERAGPD